MYFGNLRTRSYGYVKYRISNPNRKRRETDTQSQVSKQNSILDLIDTYRILWKAVFDESRMYGLEGDLSYLSRSTLQYGVKKPKKKKIDSFLVLIKRKRILEHLSPSWQETNVRGPVFYINLYLLKFLLTCKLWRRKNLLLTKSKICFFPRCQIFSRHVPTISTIYNVTCISLSSLKVDTISDFGPSWIR
jgi:hypothetical protein